jgi:potassium-transporting ATPase KdpC subunit
MSIARERQMNTGDVRSLIQRHTFSRQLGFLGELRVNVLALNLDLDATHPIQ